MPSFSNNRCDFRYCDGLAYAEIRAARYAECKGPFMFEWMRDRCIKDTATSSTKNFFADAESCVKSMPADGRRGSLSFVLLMCLTRGKEDAMKMCREICNRIVESCVLMN